MKFYLGLQKRAKFINRNHCYNKKVMPIAVSYFLSRLFLSVVAFLRRWYIGAFRWALRTTISVLDILDKRLALVITLKYFFKPLYQDYTAVGYILGVFFRLWRVVIAFVLYTFIIIVAISFYVIWSLIPLAGFRVF